MASTVHLLILQDGVRRTITTGCGESRPRQATDPLPPDITAWGSAVTCPDCLARNRQF